MAKRQRLRSDKSYSQDDLKIGQKVFREWCGDNGVNCDALSAADLCEKIAQAIAETHADLVNALKLARARIEYLGAACTDPRHFQNNADVVLPKIDAVLASVSGSGERGNG